MRKRRRNRAARKVDRLLGRSDDEAHRAESFGWTYSLEHPSKSGLIDKATRKPPLPRTRE